MRTNTFATLCKHIAAGMVGTAVLCAGVAASAAVQPKHFTPAAVLPLPNVLYVLPYAVSDHTGIAQETGSGVTAETVVSIGLPFGAPRTCNVQVQWLEFDGAIAGYSGPYPVSGSQTLEFTTAVRDLPILTPFNQNVFSNLIDKTFEGFARIRTDCTAISRLRADAKYVTDFSSTTSTPSTRIKRQEIKVVPIAGNTGD